MSQGASNGGGQAAGQGQFVKFSRQSAQRIAKAVIAVERGDRGQPAVTFDHPIPGASKSVRLCSWTASWQVDASQQVTFINSTGLTATATNVLLGVGPGEGAVVKDGTGWYLVSVKLTMQPGYNSGNVQLLGHDDGGVARWYDIFTCTTAAA